MRNLSEHIPIYAVEHDMILSKMGDLTVAYELTLPEILTLSNENYESLHQSWIKGIKALPVGTYLHKQDWFTEEHFLADFLPEASYLSHSSDRYFHERPYLQHRCRLMLTLPARDRKQVTSLYSSLLRRHIVPMETLDPAFAKSFEGTASQFIHILADTGLIVHKRLRNEELVQVVNEYLLLGRDGLRRDLDFSDGVRVGEKHCSLFTLGSAGELPAYCGARITFDRYSTDSVKFPVGFVSPICQLLPVNHLYQQFIRIEDQEAVIHRMEKKKLRLQSLSTYSRDNAIAREGAEQFLQEAVGDHRQIVSLHCHVLAWTSEAQKIQELRNACSTALTLINASAKIETVGAPQLYWAGIPGNAADLPVNDCFLTFSNQAACFINTESGYRSSNSNFGIRLGERLAGHPLLVDLSDEPMAKGIISNRNKFILGPSGSGKSFFTNHLVRSYYEQAAHIVLVDVGHSYKSLCELLGGYYFSYSDSKPICFNPFYVEPGVTPDTEKKESIKALLVALWKKDDESFSRSEYVALSNALQLYYEQDVTFRCFNSFYDFLTNDFARTLRADAVKEKDFDLGNFLYVLRPFYKGGEYDYLLNANENLDLLQQRLIVFELDNIKDHPILLPVVTIIIMEVFISKMRTLKGVRKVILIEEAWKALTRDGMAEYIKYLFKTVRKHFGEAIVVTQEIEDIISSPIVKQTIIHNSDCKILLDQSKYQHRFREVQELLGLPDAETPKILSMNKANDPALNYREVYIWPFGKVYRVEVSRQEYLCYTTEEKEKLKVSKASEKLGSIEAAIKSIVQ